MLNCVNKILATIFLVFFISCKNKSNEVTETTKLFNLYSKKIATTTVYDNIYKKANDSIHNWIDNKLIGSKMQRFSNWKLDNLICFSKKMDRCIMVIMNQENKSVSNSLNIFYGVKIKNNWFFLYGPTIYPDPYSKKGVLSFEKLHEIAMREVFSGYLKKKNKVFFGNLFGKIEWEINDRFFLELDKPVVSFETRKTSPNVYYSCRDINSKNEYEECSFKHEALSVWNEDSTSVIKDTYLYSTEIPVVKKIRKLKKGDLLRVIERIDNSKWCCVRIWDGNPYIGFVEKKAIVKKDNGR